MNQKRRFILKSMGLGTGLLLLKPWNIPSILAKEDKKKKPERYFIFCYFNGGWDLLLSLDPRDPSKFSDKKFQNKETKIQLAWDLLPKKFKDGNPITLDVKQAKNSPIAFGPAAHVLLKHADVMCVVRGISMDTVTHAVGKRYFLTGLMPAGLNARGSSIPTAIAAQQGDLTPIPNLVVRVETYNKDQPNFASGLQVTSVYDLLNTLRAGPQSPRGELRKLLEEYRNSERENCDPVNLNRDGLFSLIRNSQKKAKFLVDSNLGQRFNFLDPKNKEMLTIKKRYGIKNLASPEAQAALAYQAVKYNVAQCISIEITNRLDTHGAEWANNQIELLYTGFKALSQLISDLRSTPHPDNPNKTLLDYTTVIAFSEFGRQPFLNNRGGRDHWIASSALLFGAGVPHNKVIGQTTPNEMGPVEIDRYTGKPVSANGVTLTPTLVLASIMESAGFNTAHLRTNGLPCLMKKS